MQTTNNSYYLNHSFTKEENKSGWIFLDYRNNINNFIISFCCSGQTTLEGTWLCYRYMGIDKSQVINMQYRGNGWPSGIQIELFDGKSWFNNTENREIHLYTKAGDIVWQIFSVYHLPNTTDYLSTSFKDSSEFNSFIKLIKNRSVFNFDIDISADDKIITLSTCYRLNDRMVMHGKLIK